MKKLFLLLLLVGCVPVKTHTVIRPFVVVDKYSTYQEKMMAKYLFKDATGGMHVTYDDANLYQVNDTIHEKDIISYPK